MTMAPREITCQLGSYQYVDDVTGFSADMMLLLCDVGLTCHVHTSLQFAVLLYVYTTSCYDSNDRVY